MTEIPEIYLDLLLKKKPLAHLATVMPDGSPQNTPVWFDYTDGKIRVNSALGRTKVRNMKLGAKVALVERDLMGGEPDLRQGAREPQPMQQPKRGGHAPRMAACPDGAPLGRPGELQGDDEEAPSDEDLHRGRGHMDDAEHRQGQGDAMADGERGHGPQEPLAPLHQEHEPEHEEEMIEPGHNVLDP